MGDVNQAPDGQLANQPKSWPKEMHSEMHGVPRPRPSLTPFTVKKATIHQTRQKFQVVGRLTSFPHALRQGQGVPLLAGADGFVHAL